MDFRVSLRRLWHKRRRRVDRRPEPKKIFSNKYLRVTSLGNPDAGRLFICFTGIKQKMGGIGSEEFVGATALPGSSALFVHDLTRSWYNAFDPDLLRDVLMPRMAGKVVVTIGNSMGGFGAILATRLFPVATAIAFAPQFSVHPHIVPHETRWREYTRKIREYRHRSLAEAFTSSTRIYTINGDADARHWERFPRAANCEHLLVDNTGHDPAMAVKKAGVLSTLIRVCCDNGPAHDVLAAAGLPVRPIGQKPIREMPVGSLVEKP